MNKKVAVVIIAVAVIVGAISLLSFYPVMKNYGNTKEVNNTLSQTTVKPQGRHLTLELNESIAMKSNP